MAKGANAAALWPKRRQRGLLFVVSGPSGVGKDATIVCLRQQGFPIHFIVTATTRPPRPGEVHGVDYFFLSEQEYDALLACNEFLEHATVYGHRYGIPKQHVREVLGRGQDVIMRIDVQGAATIRRLAPEAVFIFLCPYSLDELEQRLRARGTETPESLARKLALAPREMAEWPKFDYVVVNPNDALDDAVELIKAIILAERCRVKQRRIEL